MSLNVFKRVHVSPCTPSLSSYPTLVGFICIYIYIQKTAAPFVASQGFLGGPSGLLGGPEVIHRDPPLWLHGGPLVGSVDMGYPFRGTHEQIATKTCNWHFYKAWECGYHGAGKVVRLTQECPMKPPNQVQRGRLRRLLQGKVPVKGFAWPKHPEAKCPEA